MTGAARRLAADMTPGRWRQVQSIFARAASRRGTARQVLLDEACGDDERLRADVETLLDAPSGLVRTDDPALAWLDGGVDLELPFERLGPYRLVRKLGRGGMGVVWLARREGDYEQDVAIKVIGLGLGRGTVLDRFRQERQILANLAHPSIARLLDGGVTPDGRPFLVMEAVAGQPIDVACRAKEWRVERRLALLETVCEAVQHAHRNLVVHRDLKPSNILVRDDGTPVLLDFGIAKLLAPAAGAQPADVRTVDGDRLLTPRYASPEQLDGGVITTACDVFALGVIAYELLAERHPFADRAGSDLEQAIRHETPPAPSEVAPAAWRSRVRGDLDTIVRHAMRKDPAHRYGSAAELGDDLRRFRAGLPIRARPPSRRYRLGKFVARHRAGVAAVTVAVAGLVAGLVASRFQAEVARTARGRAEASLLEADRQRATAEEAVAFLVGLFEASDPATSRGLDRTARELLAAGTASIRTTLGDQPAVRARLLETLGMVYAENGRLDEASSLVEESLSLRRAALGVHPDTARSLDRLGRVRFEQGRFAAARVAFSESLALRRWLFASGVEADVAIAQSLNNLGLCWLELDRPEQAERLIRDALVLRRDRLGDEHEDTIESLNNLGLTLLAGGDPAAARAVLEDALVTKRRVLGEPHPSVGVGLNNLARVLLEIGELDGAERMGRRLVEHNAALYGDDHPEVATAQHNLAATLKARGRHAEAEQLYLAALTQRRAMEGWRHPAVAETLIGLGAVRQATGDARQAAIDFAEAIELAEAQLGADHPTATAARANLGAARLALGDLEGAEAAFREALDRRRRRLGDDHPALAPLRGNLAALAYRRGDLAVAVREFRSVAELRARQYPGPHPERATALVNLGNALARSGRLDDAEARYREALAMRESVFGPGHAKVVGVQRPLGRVLLEQGKIDAAESVLKQALESIPMLDPPDPQLEARLRTLLARTAEEKPKPQGGEP